MGNGFGSGGGNGSGSSIPESFILNRSLVERAVSLVLPAIRLGIQEVFKRNVLSICVLDPKDGSVLYTRNINKKIWKQWGHDFGKIARSKAEIAYRAKTDTVLVKERKPWVYEKGDTIYPGGVYYRGLAIGVSGVEAHFDEIIAYWIVFAIKGLCLNEMKRLEKTMTELSYDFLGKVPG